MFLVVDFAQFFVSWIKIVSTKCKLVTNDYPCASGSVAEWSKALV